MRRDRTNFVLTILCLILYVPFQVRLKTSLFQVAECLDHDTLVNEGALALFANKILTHTIQMGHSVMLLIRSSLLV